MPQEIISPADVRKLQLAAALEKLTAGKNLTPSEQRVIDAAASGDTSEKKAADKVASQTRMALEIARHFQISCTKNTIQSWQKNCTPPFPASRPDGSYSRKECFDWVEKVYLPKVHQTGQQPDLFVQLQQAKIQRELDRSRRENIETGKLEGTVICRDLARATVIGTLKIYHGFVRRILESNSTNERREKLRQLGVSPEAIAAFYEFDIAHARGLVDAIEKQCEECGKEKRD